MIVLVSTLIFTTLKGKDYCPPQSLKNSITVFLEIIPRNNPPKISDSKFKNSPRIIPSKKCTGEGLLSYIITLKLLKNVI